MLECARIDCNGLHDWAVTAEAHVTPLLLLLLPPFTALR